MPEYLYQAVNQDGKVIEGRKETESEKRLSAELNKDGLELISSKKKTTALKKSIGKIRLKTSELANFLYQIGVQLKSGIPILNALKIQEGIEEGEGDILLLRQRLAWHIEQGKPLSEGMKEFPKVFPGYVLNIVRVGEKSGALPENLMELRDYLEWLDRNWKSFKQAMLYPAAVMLTLVLFTFIALRFIFPSILALLIELEVPLPFLTKMLILLSNLVVNYWLLIIIIAVLTPILFGLLFRYSPTAVKIKDNLLLRIPFLGELIATLAINRFLKSLILMLNSGIVITDTLEMSKEVVGNKQIEESIVKIQNSVTNGNTISSAIKNDIFFPQLVKRMMDVGERSGSLDRSLESVVMFYDDLVPRKIKAFFGVMEPVLIIITVTIAGTIAAAVFLPLVQLMSPSNLY